MYLLTFVERVRLLAYNCLDQKSFKKKSASNIKFPFNSDRMDAIYHMTS